MINHSTASNGKVGVIQFNPIPHSHFPTNQTDPHTKNAPKYKYKYKYKKKKKKKINDITKSMKIKKAMEKEKDSRLSKSAEKVDILGDVMEESFNPEI